MLSLSPMDHRPEWMSKLRHDDLAIKHAGFEEFMDEWQASIYGFLRRMLGSHDDAADASQETFIQVLKSFDSFREDAAFASWIYTIARRKGYDILRSKQKHKHADLDDSMENSWNHVLQDPHFTGDEVQAKLMAAVASLPPKQREVFILRYFEEMPYEMMSRICGTSEGALKASYHHAKNKIESHLQFHIEDRPGGIELNLESFQPSQMQVHLHSTSNEKD